MDSSNSFNICTRCGNSNALNAKYCSRCGAQLKIPDEPVICHRCHARNTPVANYCRNCGAALRAGLQTKICPRCGSEVNVADAICKCGYSFVTRQQGAAPTTEAVTLKHGKVYGTRNGRGWAIAALVMLVLLLLYAFVPYRIYSNGQVAVQFRPDALVNIDKGFMYSTQGNPRNFYVVDLIIEQINGAVDYGINVAQLLLTICVGAFAITMLAHIGVAISRICNKKQSARPNWYFLAMAIATTLVIGLLTLFGMLSPAGPQWFVTVTDVFRLPEGYALGWTSWIVPIYFWFFFFYSLLAKASNKSA